MTTETTTTAIVQLGTLTAMDLFRGDGTMGKILDRIREEALAGPADTTTATGRKAIASRAYKVAQSKTLLDNMGKRLVEDSKRAIAVVDGERKAMRDALDALKNEVRSPLTDWEAAQSAADAYILEVQKIGRTANICLTADQLVSLWNQATQIDHAGLPADRTNDCKDALSQTEMAIDEVLTHRRRLDAERAELERLRAEAEQRAREIELARVKAEAESLELERQKAEAKRVEAAEKAGADAERERQAAERQQQLEAERRRVANAKHRTTVESQVTAALNVAGIADDIARQVVTLASTGRAGPMVIVY